MGTELYDCSWCGSAKSIEHGLCQVCLMEFSHDTKIIALPVKPKVTAPATPAVTPAAEAD